MVYLSKAYMSAVFGGYYIEFDDKWILLMSSKSIYKVKYLNNKKSARSAVFNPEQYKYAPKK